MTYSDKHYSSPATNFQKELTILLLFWALVFGGFVRLYPSITGETPINDGGLFYVMTNELKANNYSVPTYTHFNNADLPYAYPPLSFYLVASISSLTGISVLELFRFLPAILATLTIPAVYWLARKFLPSNLEAALAAVFYAMIPRGYLWFIMGGGIPRVLGCIFSLLFLYYLLQLFSGIHPYRYIFLSGVFLALLILSHPEWLYHTVCILLVFWLLHKERLRHALWIAAVALLSAALTAPWWITMLMRFGFAPYLSAMQTGGFSPLFWGPLLLFNITEEPYVGLIAGLALLGIIVCLLNKRWVILLWLCIPFAVEARNASAVADIPVAILASIGFSQILLPGIAALDRKLRRGKDSLAETDLPNALAQDRDLFQTPAFKWLLFFLLIYTLMGSFLYDWTISSLRLSADDLSAMQWVKNNTPASSRILVIGFGGEFDSPLQEWLPALTQRVNPAVVQGYEWTEGNNFFARMRRLTALNACTWETVACVESWAQENNISFDYILVRFHPYTYANLQDLTGKLLDYTLQNSNAYHLEFINSTLVIYKRNVP